MRKPWVIAVLMVVGLITVLLCWPSASYDLARVHPSLRDLPRPYRSIKASSFLDGGSMGVEVIGGDGTIREFAFPVHERAGRRPDYPQLFFSERAGVRLPMDGPMAEITNSPDTRAMLIRLIESDATPDGDRALVLIGLRGGPKDYLSLAKYAAWGKYRQ
ncbi:MAG TPA: hypothetical protein VMB21_14370 [Candidatus Limnocylindria bacterium]|nr:hypothetical protein [Candidatus Limnocylindria bacterium]